ncbi:MAG: hypothetical protein ABJM06_02840 [Gilvibacter sp.]
MESVKIKTLLDSYLEGTTTLAQENELRNYFASTEVGPELAPYKAMFGEFSNLEAETYNKPVVVQKAGFWQKPWQYGIAAMLVVALGLAYFMSPTDNGYTEEEKLAIAQYEKFKEHMAMISGELNNGIEEMVYLTEFEKATDQFFK